MFEPIWLAITLVSLILMIQQSRKTTTNQKIPRQHGPPLPPGPTPWPILGSIPDLWLNRPAYKWVHRVMDELKTDIACFRLGKCHVVAVNSPELAREFLKTHDAVFASRPKTFETELMSSGYLTTALVPMGDQWKKMRKILVHNVINSSNIRWLLNMRNLEADNLVRFIHNQCSNNNSQGNVVNVRTFAKHYSANVMRRVIFGIRHFGEKTKDGGPSLEEEEHVSAFYTLLLHIYSFSLSEYFPVLKWLDLDGHYKHVRNAMEVVKKYHDPIIDDRIRHWKNGTRTKPEDLLDIFISLTDSEGNRLLSDEEIRAQVTDIYTAGLDNPFIVTEWGLAEMLNNPETMKKAIEELDEVVGKDRLVQESDFPNLPYLSACARESLRLHPVAPFNLPHVSTADCTVAGYFIPKGSTVLLGRLGLGRNPNVWKDPMRFDPSRHLSSGHVDLAENELKFISFSTGRRGCAGFGLGSKTILMLLARTLQGFTWTIPNGLTKIDFGESVWLSKTKPLYAHAKPRLHASVYQSLSCEKA